LKEDFLEVDAKEQFYIRIEDPTEKWNLFHKHTRNDIRKSEKSNLTLKSINDLTELKNFYKLYFKEMKRFGTPCHSFKFFNNLMDSFKDDFCGLNCYSDGNLIASGILILEDEVSYLWFNVSNLKYREYRPNDLIYWTFIKKVHERGVKWIDVGQVDINSSESHAKGLFSFKNKWLGEVHKRKYFIYSFDKLNSDNLSQKKKLKKFRNVWSKLPSFLIKIIGPKICSQLGV
jgi:lipid II:glycine glycyltransferase (peptidoglycan interpeptide bridge formation enzyme)